MLTNKELWHSIVIDGTLNRVIFSYEKAFAERNTSLDKRVFLSVGEREQERMVSDFNTMLSSLVSRQYAGLRLQSHVFEGETHASGMGIALNRGMRSVLNTK